MDDAMAVEELVVEITSAIDAVRAGVNEIATNKSLFLRSTLFMVELKQVALRQCPGNALLGILDDVSRFKGLVDQCCRRKSRVLQVYRSPATSETIRVIMDDLSSHLDLCMDIKENDTILELKTKIGRGNFSPDPGNCEFAASLREAISTGSNSSLQDDGGKESLLEDLARQLAAPLSSLREELREDKKVAEDEGCLEDLAEIEELLKLLDSGRAPTTDASVLDLDDNSFSDAIPSSFLCPITRQVMREPVLVEGGVTYEKSAIMEWISLGNTKCPVTNADLKNMVPNRSMENAIRHYVDRVNIDKMTRAIKKIKAGPVHVEETLEAIKSLTDSDACFKRHVVALDGLSPLVTILKNGTVDQSAKALKILVSVGEAGDDCKMSIVEAGGVPVVLRILRKCHGDNPDAVSLLCKISEVQNGKDAILEEPGSVIIIVSAITLDSVEQESNAMKLLENLCSNKPWVAIEAASSGIYHHLISNLRTGDGALKLEMAEAIATKLELNDASSAALVSAGILGPLIEMLKSGDIDNNAAATKCLHKLSFIAANRSAITDAGGIPLLVSSTRVGTLKHQDLKVYAFKTLANLVRGQESVAALADEDVIWFLEMVKDEDSKVQESIIKIILYVTRESKSFRLELRRRSETIRYLLGLSSRDSSEIRTSALGIIFQLAADRETREAIHPRSSIHLSKHLEQGSTPTEDKELALGILAGITKNGPESRQAVAATNPYGFIATYLQTGTQRMREDAAAVLTRLTESVLDKDTDKELARLDIVRLLRETLQSGTERAKEHASGTLANLSKRTPLLTERQSFLKRLLARLGLKLYTQCAVHPGKCNLKTSFCIVETGVVPLLIAEVRSSNARNAERGIDALLTLVQDETFRQKGVDFLMKNSALAPVVSLVGRSNSLTEKAMILLERIFKCRKYRDEKYSKIAKSSLSTTMTSGSIQARKSAAKALMHLGMMSKGSTYTTTSTTEPVMK